MIIISSYNVESLEIAYDILKTIEDKKVVFLSDALYLFNSDTNDTINRMLNLGVKLIVLEIDLRKRGMDADLCRITPISYEELVSQLLEKKVGIVNL